MASLVPDQVNKRNRDSILQRRWELHIIKPSQEILEIQKALAKALGYEDDATASETEADDDENDQLYVSTSYFINRWNEV